MSRVGQGNQDEVKTIQPFDTFVAGATTGTVSRAIVQPFDVVKIRLQLQAESKGNAKYKSLLHSVSMIMKEEGVRAFWKGHVSGQFLSILYGSLHFGLYQNLWYRAVITEQLDNQSKARVALADLLFGVSTAVPATVVSYPFDVVRTRMVSQFSFVSLTPTSDKQHYKGVVDAFVKIGRKEGSAGFFKGLAPALYTLPLASGLNFCIYNYIKPYYAPHVTKFDQLNIPYLSQAATLVFGGVSGALSKTVTFPLDTVKKRLQVQGFERGRAVMGVTPKYNGFIHCFFTILRDEGVTRGLYKGWLPGIIKAFPSGALQFYLLERSLYLIAYFKRARDS